MNFFSSQSAAERYPKGRPYFHPLVIERIRTFLSSTKQVQRAIDVGCGTGLSTVSLKEIAGEVIGVDSSLEMIALAERTKSVRYVLADAVKLPFGENDFDLMTLSSAFHWLDRREFLREAGRVLRPRGWLIVYDNYFSGRAKGDAAFQTYLTKFPSPPRAGLNFTTEDADNEGFHLAWHEFYQNTISFSLEGLIDYLLTHSNIIAAVERGGEDINRVRLWLAENFEPSFGGRKEVDFLFSGPIWYLENRSQKG